MMDAQPLTDLFGALADPTRRAILLQLASGEATVNELALPHAMSLPAISKHLKVLANAGLIGRSRRAQQRPCRLAPEVLDAIDEWLDALRSRQPAAFDVLENPNEDMRKWEDDKSGP